MTRPVVLLIDDEPDHCALHALTLERAGYEVRTTTSPREALDQLEDVSVVVTDISMEEMNGLIVCERVHAAAPDIPVVLVTGLSSLETAVAALRAGAYDFLLKPLNPELLVVSVARALEWHKLRREVAVLRSSKSPMTAGLFGESRAMKQVREMIARIAGSSASVLIRGETGTGKELVARAIHAQSTRASGPFVAINCAAVAPTLLESELFGHAKGAFTDAKETRTGLFVQANKGTLFLDEIGEMPLDMQVKLLRALQTRAVRPVGGNVDIPFDVRLLSATHKDLEAAIADHEFREDLFYRINVVSIALPTLHERGRDILLLAERFLAQTAARQGTPPPTIPSEVAAKLLAYSWPGNVRELENCMERAVALGSGVLSVADLPNRVRDHVSETFALDAGDGAEILTIDELGRRYTTRVLRLLNGNKSRAAVMLGLDRRTLHRRLERDEGARPG